MADFIKIAKAAEEALEHSPQAKQLAVKMLEETGILGQAVKFVTKEFEHLAGSVETKKFLSTIKHTFENEIPFQSQHVKGSFAKCVTLDARKFQTIENATGITELRKLQATGSGLGSDVLKHGPAPANLIELNPNLAEKGIPNWYHGNDDWLFYQANKTFPNRVILNDAGKLHAIEYDQEVMAVSGPFKGFTGQRFEITELEDGAKLARMRFPGGRNISGHYDDYEYLSGTPSIKCRNWNALEQKFKTPDELLPEDIIGHENQFVRKYWD